VEVRKRKKIKYKGHKVTPREKNKRAQGGLFVFRKKRGTNNPIPDSILYTRASSLHRMLGFPRNNGHKKCPDGVD
jgi:hypothetical protein